MSGCSSIADDRLRGCFVGHIPQSEILGCHANGRGLVDPVPLSRPTPVLGTMTMVPKSRINSSGSYGGLLFFDIRCLRAVFLRWVHSPTNRMSCID